MWDGRHTEIRPFKDKDSVSRRLWIKVLLTVEMVAVTKLSANFLNRGQSDHTCHHPHSCIELATKSEKWNGKQSPACINAWHPASKLLWKYYSAQARVMGNDIADRLVGKATTASTSRILSVEEIAKVFHCPSLGCASAWPYKLYVHS